MADATAAPPIVLKAALVGVGLGLWFLTQSLLRYRPDGTGVLGDGLHMVTARWHRFLLANPKWADRLLIVSSFCIDALGLFVLGLCIFGPSVGPFVGLMLLFFSRQVCQALCALPPPEGMIWRATGVPTLLVTYGTSNDLFFSGHTALAVYGSIMLGLWGGPAWAAVGIAVAVFEVTTVIVPRAHYTMDVFTGAIAAFAAAVLADWWGQACDRWLAALGRGMRLS